MEYPMSYILLVAALVFGVFWIWFCGGFQKREVRQREHIVDKTTTEDKKE